MVINVHAGHNPDGKVACGAVGIIRESTEARNVKNEVIRQLKAIGHTVYDCTCENGLNANNVLCNIVGNCNSHAVDLDVSIHFNAGAKDNAGNGATTGVEAYIYSDTSKAKTYAEKVVNVIAKLGFKNRGVKINKKLYFLNHTKAAAMLIECCFVDDKDDVALYDYKSMADAIVYGITGKYYEETINISVDSEAGASGAETATGDATAIYRVQVGAYRNKDNAVALQAKLKAAGFDVAIVKA
nr:MAG TPA: Cell wall hydrolase autolysin [Caudoviricetes sp.]